VVNSGLQAAAVVLYIQQEQYLLAVADPLLVVLMLAVVQVLQVEQVVMELQILAAAVAVKREVQHLFWEVLAVVQELL
jgi:hypothetical protein